jgi:hypothetical protein
MRMRGQMRGQRQKLAFHVPPLWRTLWARAATPQSPTMRATELPATETEAGGVAETETWILCPAPLATMWATATTLQSPIMSAAQPPEPETGTEAEREAGTGARAEAEGETETVPEAGTETWIACSAPLAHTAGHSRDSSTSDRECNVAPRDADGNRDGMSGRGEERDGDGGRGRGRGRGGDGDVDSMFRASRPQCGPRQRLLDLEPRARPSCRRQ